MVDIHAIVTSIPDPVIFDRNEMEWLLQEVQAINPKVILQIGTNQGKSAKCFLDAFNPECFITIDILPKNKIAPPVLESEISTDIYLWEKDSTLPSTIEQIANILGERKVDFLFIDGAHDFVTVAKDFDNYKQFVRPGGIIAFDDIYSNNRKDLQVDVVWNLLKREYPKFKEYKDNLVATGIGVLYV